MNIDKNLEYLRDMVGRFPIKEDNPYKWNRWLGFVQGALWAMNFNTVEVLKNENKGGLVQAFNKIHARVRIEIVKRREINDNRT